jgi:hypothetical protein
MAPVNVVSEREEDRAMLSGLAPTVDNLFFLAVLSLGWGLSLATYRLFARRRAWPMGTWQAELPFLPVLIGLIGLLAGLAFAAVRGAGDGGVVIILLGLILAALWTGLLRVGSQVSLFLAPIATFLLLLGWLAVPLGLSERRWASERPAETLERRGILPSDSATMTRQP